jgi:hypothetical protein
VGRGARRRVDQELEELFTAMRTAAAAYLAAVQQRADAWADMVARAEALGFDVSPTVPGRLSRPLPAIAAAILDEARAHLALGRHDG